MLRSVIPIARNTFIELVRQKVFNILLVFALCALASSLFMAELSFAEQFQMLKDVCLGTMAIFTSILAILATAGFLPRDMEDRTIYTLLAKPVPRFAYLLGKLLGIVFLLLLFILLMSAVFCVVLYARERIALSYTEIQFSGVHSDEYWKEVASIKGSAFNFNLVPGITIIFVKAALLAAMTLLVSTFSTSFLFTVMISVAAYFIGHLQATAREVWFQEAGHEWMRILITPIALLFPDLQAFSLSDDVIAGAAIPLGIFLQTFALGGLYVVIYFAVASFVFAGREL